MSYLQTMGNEVLTEKVKLLEVKLRSELSLQEYIALNNLMLRKLNDRFFNEESDERLKECY